MSDELRVSLELVIGWFRQLWLRWKERNDPPIPWGHVRIENRGEGSICVGAIDSHFVISAGETLDIPVYNIRLEPGPNAVDDDAPVEWTRPGWML